MPSQNNSVAASPRPSTHPTTQPQPPLATHLPENGEVLRVEVELENRAAAVARLVYRQEPHKGLRVNRQRSERGEAGEILADQDHAAVARGQVQPSH